MNDIAIFEHYEFGRVRTLIEDGEVLFAGSDVASALGYNQPHKAIERHSRYGMKRTAPHPQSKDKTIEMNFIPEPDLYRLVFRSKLPNAEKFIDWVVSETLDLIQDDLI